MSLVNKINQAVSASANLAYSCTLPTLNGISGFALSAKHTIGGPLLEQVPDQLSLIIFSSFVSYNLSKWNAHANNRPEILGEKFALKDTQSMVASCYMNFFGAYAAGTALSHYILNYL